jgi:hypothetical protein
MCGNLQDGVDSQALILSGSAYLNVVVPFGISIQETPQQTSSIPGCTL